jgi:hypothetical protein
MLQLEQFSEELLEFDVGSTAVILTEGNQPLHDVLLQFDSLPEHPPRVVHGTEKMHKILTVLLLCMAPV